MMMQPQPDDGLPRDLAFRITAIRETFEESGIFLQEKGNQIPAEELGIYRPQVRLTILVSVINCYIHDRSTWTPLHF